MTTSDKSTIFCYFTSQGFPTGLMTMAERLYAANPDEYKSIRDLLKATLIAYAESI